MLDTHGYRQGIKQEIEKNVFHERYNEKSN